MKVHINLHFSTFSLLAFCITKGSPGTIPKAKGPLKEGKGGEESETAHVAATNKPTKIPRSFLFVCLLTKETAQEAARFRPGHRVCDPGKVEQHFCISSSSLAK